MTEQNVIDSGAARDRLVSRLEGADLVGLLSRPSSVAIVGASGTPGAYSHRAFSYLRDYGYAGRVELVNPNRSEIEGRPCVASVTDLAPGSIDFAMVAVNAGQVVASTRELAAIGVPAAVVIAGGVTDEDKRALAEISTRSGMRIIGPNCIGVVATGSNTYVSFSRVVGQAKPRSGSVALVTQSGAMGNALLLSLLRRGAGISHWITTGDEANVGALELIAGLLDQEDVRSVGVFFEGMGDLEWMPALRDAISRTGKSVYVVKGAQTAAGAGAAAGHTGRVVGSAEASISVMRDAGITVLGSMPQLADALVVSDLIGPLPGRRTAIVTVSGGAGVLAADAVVRSGELELSVLAGDADLEARLGGRVHEVANPLDVAGSTTEVYAEWVNAVGRRPSTDVVLAIQANIMHDEKVLGNDLSADKERTAPLVVVPFSEEDPLSSEVILQLAAAGVPVVASAERAIAALAALPISAKDKAAAVEPVHPEDSDVLGLEDAITLVGDELPWSPFEIAADLESARAASERLGFPVVLKAAGRTLHHRSESGAVAVGVTANSLPEAWATVSGAVAAAGDAVMVQAMVPKGTEVMVSALTDPELGPVAIIRPGGIYTELIRGSAILWGGWDLASREAALRGSTVGTLLDGYRGGPVYAITPLAEVVESLLGTLRSGRVSFIELNPVIVTTHGVHLVDALVKR